MTTSKTIKKIERKKHTIDATDKVFGRLAVEAAGLLRGKAKVDFKRHDFMPFNSADK